MKNYRSIVSKIRGPLVPITTPFKDNDELDVESVCRWVDWLIQQGIKLFWTTYGTSHYACLTDIELMILNKEIAAVTRGRATLIAGTNFHWPERQCREFIEFVASAGADVVMLQVDWRFNPNDNVVFDFYRSLAEQSPLPLFGYTLAGPGVNGMSLAFLERLLDLPQFVGMKNDSGDFYENCAYLRAVRLKKAAFAVMTGGSMMSFLHARPFGGMAYAAAIGFFAPRVPLAFSAHLEKGEADQAVELIKEYEEPYYDLLKKLPWSNYAFDHTALKLLGQFKSDRMRYPFKTCDREAANAIRKFLVEKRLLPG